MIRATVEGYMTEDQAVSVMMDIESADLMFNLRLDDWLEADKFNLLMTLSGLEITLTGRMVFLQRILAFCSEICFTELRFKEEFYESSINHRYAGVLP